MAENVVNMIVLGPSRVGKTSLLATMYNEFSKLGGSFNFRAIGETSDLLGDAYQRLSDVMQKDRFTVVGDLMPGNKDFLEHRFEVSFQGAKEFEIVFHDYRGGTLMKVTDPEFPELKSKVAASHVIFNVLDAVALMESDPFQSDKLNAHNRVFELLSETLKANEKYLIVFVLVKCEAYMKSAEKRESLLDRFQDRHKSVLSLLGKLNESGRNVAAVLIPVKTLGCVEFKELVIEEGQTEPSFVFMRTHREFAPQDVDQPLRYALPFALNHVNENRSFFDSAWRYISGKSVAFKHALKEFCNHRNREDGKVYRKYGNSELLEVK